jgi:site-specific recombinase XerD
MTYNIKRAYKKEDKKMKALRQFTVYMQVEKNYPNSTIDTYLQAIDEFIDTMSIKNLDKVTKYEIREYLSALKNRGNTPPTRNKKLSALRTFFNFLCREDIIKTNPTFGIENSKTKKCLPKILSDSDIAKLFKATNENRTIDLRNKIILELFLASGMRISELTNLQICHIDFSNQSILVFGKGQKERICPLDEPTIVLIQRYVESRGIESKYLFSCRGGKSMDITGVRKIIYKIGKLAGVEIHPHLLRHAFAKDLLDNGADIRVIQEMLGHANIGSTQIYTKVGNKLLVDTYNRCHSKRSSS